MYMNKKTVEEILPQKKPFKFVDTIESLDFEQKSIVCNQMFKKEDFYFSGHFPQKPIVPGVLIIESVAQSSLLLISEILRTKTQIGYLVNVKKATYYVPLKPDDSVIIKSKVNQRVANYFIVKATVLKDNTVIAKMELSLSM